MTAKINMQHGKLTASEKTISYKLSLSHISCKNLPLVHNEFMDKLIELGVNIIDAGMFIISAASNNSNRPGQITMYVNRINLKNVDISMFPYEPHCID